MTLALGSGAARGYAHIPIIKFLRENGCEIEHISGCSAGALVGAYFCLHGEVDSLIDMLRKMKTSDFQDLLDPQNPRKALFKGEKIIKWMRKNLYGDATFDDLKIPLVINATDITTPEEVYIEKGDLTKAVRASISLPGIFPPYHYLGKHMVDGGVMDPVPSNILLEKGYEKVMAVNLNKDFHFPPEKEKTAISVVTQTFYLMMRGLSLKQQDPRVFLVSPEFYLSPSQALDFTDFENINKAGEMALMDRMDEIEEWLKS